MILVMQLFQYKQSETDPPQLRQGKQVRQAEISECLLRNIRNPCFSEIHILLEHESDRAYYTRLLEAIERREKCRYSIFGRQPLYSDLVEYVRDNISPNTVVCIMNSDIYLDPAASIDFINNEADDSSLLCLTRHEHTDNTHSTCNISTCSLIFNYRGSHDAFIFRTPVPEQFLYEQVRIPQNVYGSESVFMKAWVNAGKTLKNPCFDVRIFHMHHGSFRSSQYRTVANGYLCNKSPDIPEGRIDLKEQVTSLFD